ncbi:hypothetical protein AZE42_05403 [Rhizopogon vesiculosus]|uniref:Uncharacterized protein n=1 Tax=Rhizopogon vesiculosus TaxID=180088 RepID=A0A1J8QWK2_9AGAM|nr:hypothetical protein AZE42_05403 [Rhizopogon vesiculosus]
MLVKIFSFPCLWSFHDLYVWLQQAFSLYTVIHDWVIHIFIKLIDPHNNAYGYPWSLLQIILVLILATCFLRTFIPRPPKENSHHARTVIQALQTVLVPTCSLWPTRYIRLVKRASTHGHGSASKIVIPLSMLLQDVRDGLMELRDPVCDLEDLMDGGVSAYGCYVCLRIDWKWRVHWLDRVVRIYDPLQGDLSGNTKSWAADSSYLLADMQRVRRLAPGASPSPGLQSIINLDNKPLSHLATIQLPRGCRATLEFTSLSSSISVLSTTHTLCMMPFLTRRLPYRLSDVFAAVSNTRNFKLTSLSNTSETYANSLAAASTKLTDDPVVRKQYVDEVGIKGWRERRLMIAFEAALVRKGWLEHWEAILVAR